MQNLEQKIIMSRTLERLYQLSRVVPTDIHNHDDLKKALSTCSTEIMNALDDDRLHFDREDDKAMFFLLLTVVVDFTIDGKLKTAFTQATIN